MKRSDEFEIEKSTIHDQFKPESGLISLFGDSADLGDEFGF